MTEAETPAEPAAETPPGSVPRPRGWASLYGLAFLLMLGAAAALAIAGRGFLASTRLLWLSAGLSAAAIVVAVAGLLLPRRR